MAVITVDAVDGVASAIWNTAEGTSKRGQSGPACQIQEAEAVNGEGGAMWGAGLSSEGSMSVASRESKACGLGFLD